ncbi:transmembrane sensor [Pedobacter africanus]|uniref:Ferric-dicitrate binding protein FerR (Iron transport regulator) n=1 Tax=Pedobacter africanus TaxID=151894 RepID=A0ACC6KXH9_9SPHI|nr:FecR domain-containing protein [Pedobacter africanus]MDR6783781.1 ferric-dicitrate binding protein FerR (iron transport regulator) [Pedobacter africanus]
MDRENIKHLLSKFKAGTASEEEKAFLELWYAQFKDAEGHEYLLADRLADASEIWANLPVYNEQKKTVKLWRRIAAAAAIIITLGAGIYFTQNQKAKVYDNDIAPGGNKATLTLANGNIISLSEVKTGVVIDASKLTYDDGSAVGPLNALDPLSPARRAGRSPEGEGWQTLTTPKGGIYSIILQDGTKVWLNSDSKLEFFSDYRNKLQRIVKLTGEAYFEAAKDKTKPFLVESNGQRVTVLGTHFNISAYRGESIKTTLLEGSVSVRQAAPVRSLSYRGDDGDGAIILKPGQLAINAASNIRVQAADLEKEMAWKNGYFRFNQEGIQDIMRKLSRWYNIEVAYQGNITTEKFTGTVNRDKNISEVLLMLEQTKGVHFKIEGRKVTVIP